MTSKTHVALGLLCSLATIKYYPDVDTYVTISACCIGSLIPDLDTKKSDPSQIFPPISYIVDKVTKHRGFTHTMLPLIFVILYFIYQSYPCLMVGLGGLSHVGIDEITKAVGVKCNSTGEKVLYNVLWALNGLVVVNVLAGYFEL